MKKIDGWIVEYNIGSTPPFLDLSCWIIDFLPAIIDDEVDNLELLVLVRSAQKHLSLSL